MSVVVPTTPTGAAGTGQGDRRQYPVNLELAGRRVLLVGGGRIALRKAQQVLECGADLTVLAPEITEEFCRLPVSMVRRRFESGDLAGYRLVITATGAQEVDQQIYDEAETLGIWVNSADDPERCSFTLPAVVRRGRLMVTVSTAGASPALSSWLRRRLEHEIGSEFAAIVEDLAAERGRVHDAGASTEDIDWTPIIERIVLAHRAGSAPAHTAPTDLTGVAP